MQFFVGKATEHLIGEGVKPEHLNDSRIGRVLDQLYEQGLSRVFLEMALAAVKRFGVNTQRVHPLPSLGLLFLEFFDLLL